MNDLLHKDNIIAGFSTEDKASLKGMNEIVDIRFEPKHKYFHDHLIESITQSNGVKLSDKFRIGHLRDKANKSLINGRRNFPLKKDMFNEFRNCVPHSWPKTLEEDQMKPI